MTQINPWIGLNPYSEGDRLYGRDDDTERFMKMLLAERVVVLCGKSGVGKTSFIRSCVCPLVREKGIIPVVVRLFPNDYNNSHISQIKQSIYDTLKDLPEEVFINELYPLKEGEIESFRSFFERNRIEKANGEVIKPLIIIDQFEELFSVNSDLPIFKQIDEGISYEYKDEEGQKQNPFYLLISIREDFVSFIDRGFVSKDLRINRFYLDDLNEEQAYKVITKDGKVNIDKKTAILIIESITGRHDFSLDGIPEISVPAHMLSIYLYRLYEKSLSDNQGVITDELVKLYDGISCFKDLYNEATEIVSVQAIDYIEDVLVTPDGRRNDISESEVIRSGCVKKEELDLLIGRNILTRVHFGNDIRIQLSSDIFCPIIYEHILEREKLRAMNREQELKEERTVQEMAEIIEKPQYDVFISSKSDDYHYADDVYNYLIHNGFKTFFANKELDKIGEAEYADAIDTALDATTHMIVVASSAKNVKSKWVHYEWSTFRNDLNSDYREGNLLTILIGIEPRTLPAGLRHQQSFKFESFNDGRIFGYLNKKKKNVDNNSISTRIENDVQVIADSNNKNKDILRKLGLSKTVNVTKEKKSFTFDFEMLTNSEEINWDRFIDAVICNRVVPVIGPDIIRVGNESFVQSFIEAIAKSIGIDNCKITSLDQLVCHENFLKYGHNNVHSLLSRTLIQYEEHVKKDVNCGILLQLLSTHYFPFVLTTTIDGMLEKKLRELYGGKLSVLVFDNDPMHMASSGDIRKGSDLSKPTLYYMYGKASYSNRFVVTNDDLRSFSKSWLSEFTSPKYLRQVLQQRYLLFLGYDYNNGIDSFFLQDLRLSKDSITHPEPIYEFIQLIEEGIEQYPDLVVNEIIRRIKEKEKEIENAKFNSPQRGYDVYISYSRSDSEIAQRLYESLAKSGLQVWYDKMNLSIGSDYMDEICNAIRTARYFVPILTQNITKEKNEPRMYRREWNEASEHAKCMGRTFIIPIAEEGFDFNKSAIPEEIREHDAIFFSKDVVFDDVAKQIIQIMYQD